MRKLPTEYIAKFEKAINSLNFCSASITCYVKNGQCRFVFTWEESCLGKDDDSEKEKKQGAAK